MESISIDAIPSQQFNISLGGNNYKIKIYSIDGHMSYDLSINSVGVISGFKLVNDVPLLPYKYQEINGNIILSLPEDEIPDYERFGLSQFLFYLDEDETIEYREAANL
ncbi:hypothetical protein MAELSTROM_42 [Pseudoalteromonas phage Maelstrom]|uniref:virion structural protein n=1 Tax=Pseudoalteromonas phage Maelstrom TaxID=2065202 RepID=UPI000CA1402B|nr:virion structural protein [Pseudoalteromonas phage Maelstrom]AUG84961.1 hypothetical protein MAELSTROM_42 [Pseudoalteromonas phage Maelstrom]